MPSLPLLLLFFVVVAFAASDLEKLLAQERWFPMQGLPPHSLNHSTVSAQCQKDVETWLLDLESLATDVYHCYLETNPNCTAETKANIKKNVYALKQLDAFGRIPPGVLDIDLTQAGSETECKEVSKHYVYRTHYCYVYSILGQNATCDSSTSQNPLVLKTAVCMPSSCSPEDIPVIMVSVGGGSGLTKACSAQCVPEKPHTNVFFWIFVGFLSTLTGICILASGVDFARETYLGRTSATAVGGLKVLLAFSFYTNGSSILDTSPAKEGHLKSLDCIRFFSMLWVVAGHVAILFVENDTLQPLLTMFKPIGVDTLADAVFSVDTFFTLSGLLVSYMFFKQMSKNRKLVKNPFTWILFYVHRYLRLTPPYMLFICFYIAFVPVMIGQNALLMGNQPTVDVCVKYWWRNLIYINNFDTQTSCYAISWYLAADTQMYLVAPIFLVALFISHWLGLVVILGAISGSVGLNFYYTYHYNLAASIVRAGTTMDFFNKLYVTPWIRITPYLVGLYVGHLLALFPKSKRPNVHFLVPLIGWVFFLSVGLAIIYGPHDYIAFEANWSKFVCALYYSLARIGWGMAICWVVVANHYGWGGPIAAFMDLPIWQPLGRLSYTAYLVHFFLIMYYMNLSDRPLHFTTLLGQFQMYTIPITVLAYVFAFVWSCLCELPFLKLEKMAVDGLMQTRRRPEVEPLEKNLEQNWEAEEKDEKF